MSIFAFTADRLTKTVSEMLSMHHRSDSGGLSDLRTSRAESSSSSIVSNGMSRQDTDAEDESSPQQPRVKDYLLSALCHCP